MLPIQQQLNNLRPHTLRLNRVSLCLGVIVGIGYQCLAMPNLGGFVLGVLTSLANAWIMWIINDRALQSRNANTPERSPFGQTCFLSISTLACLLSSFSVWTHTYYSVILLAPLLPIPLWTMAVLGHVCALSFAFSTLLFSALQLYRHRQSLPSPESPNNHLMRVQLLTRYLTTLNNALHSLITIAHVWATDSHASSLVLGVLCSLCDFVVLHIFNHHLLAEPNTVTQRHPTSLISPNAFVALSSLCIVGSKLGSFLVYYQGVSILSLALGFWPIAATLMAITVASTATLAGLLFSATQACEWYQRLYPSEEDTRANNPSLAFSL